MASTPRTPRRGLPRVPGGEPWPPAASGVPDFAASGVAPDASISQEGADLAGSEQRTAMISTKPEVASQDAADPSAEPVAAAAATADPEGRTTADASAAPRTPVRRGLPREPGGEPWPPASVPIAREASRAAPASDRPGDEAVSDSARTTDLADPVRIEAVAQPAASSASTDAATTGVRRGLPREPGGEPWPLASAPTAGDAAAETRAGNGAAAVPAPVSGAAAPGPSAVDSEQSSGIGAASSARPNPSRAADSADAPAATRPVRSDAAPSTGGASVAAPTRPAAPTSSPNDAATAPAAASRAPLTVPRTVWPGAAARRAPSVAAHRAPSSSAAARRPAAPASPHGATARLGDYSPVQLLGSAAVLGILALAVVGITVLFARFVLALGPGQEFLAAYPGEYPLPESAPVGIPAWLNWSHFVNSFFLLFIIRTGWQVRNEKRPSAFWSPRKNKRRRISLTLWFHQAVDILWIANGVIFVILLLVTGQWMRIVPTSWEVFPNALSAALQYVSLDWPTENGWVNYNSLQQLSYFAITFVAAPLAILSGVRLSGVWPKDAEKLNRLYPVEWARKVHFPVMLFFVAFIVVHVALVLATGALRNLNHMYAARGAVAPGEYASDPTGLLIFAATLVVMAAGVVAARPRVLVPIARLFGEVKQR